MVAARAEARRTERHQSLVDAAIAVFVEKGVEATTVDDIVRRAGAAKGTFYLYFRTKDDVINAVSESLVSRVADSIEAVLVSPASAPDRIRALSRTLNTVGREPYELELVEVLHRPENRAVHDRIGARILDRLAPLLSRVIADGIAAGDFVDQDPDRAARYALSCLDALHDVVVSPDDLPVATEELDAFVLRGLGWNGAKPR
jgi:AcrR family transcriptional regulator